mmetsp:Transcript_5694/g.7474  ORF Transcript_5694/g.7474 Transcript_5694/m.7474 type:complete len:341 (-) Transcript_5694:508-1530(-)
MPIVRVGKTKVDTELWRFASSLKPDEDALFKLKEAFDDFMKMFKQVLNIQLSSLFENEPELCEYFGTSEFEVEGYKVGSIGNATDFVGSDLDSIVVLNASERNKVKYLPDKRNGKGEVYVYTSGEEKPVSPVAHLLGEVFCKSVEETKEQIGESRFPFEIDSRETGKIRYTFKNGDIEFDMLPALQDNLGRNILLNTLELSNNKSMSSKIAKYNDTFKGFIPFIKVLKLLKHSCDIKLPSCMFEQLAIEIAHTKGITWWNAESTIGILRECMSSLKGLLKESGQLVPLHAYNENLLERFEKNSEEKQRFLKWINSITEETEDTLLEQLGKLKDSVSNGNK